MAIAHVCLNCGQDMGHAPALRDAATGLTIVQCPSCGGRACRGRNAVSAGFRRGRRLVMTLLGLGLRLVVLSAAALLVIAPTSMLVHELFREAGAWGVSTSGPKLLVRLVQRLASSAEARDGFMGWLVDPEILLLVVLWGVGSAVSVVALSVLLRHWKLPVAMAVWTAFLVALMFLARGVHVFAWYVDQGWGGVLSEWSRVHSREWPDNVAMIIAGSVLSLVVVPPAIWLRRLNDGIWAMLRSWYRRRARAARRRA